MLSTFISILIRGWEKVILLIAFVLCLFLCTLAARYFSDTEENLYSTGHKPTATPFFPWQDRSFFHPSIPEASKANPFAHTIVNRLKPPEPPKPATPEPPKKEQPETTAKSEQPQQNPQATAKQPKQQETTKPAEPPKPPPPPPKPDIVFTICYRGFYVDVRGETLAMLIVTNPDKKESRLICKKGMEICGKVTFQQADDSKATFTDAQGNATDIAWNAKHTFTFKQE
ncbi:MAG: hypothetical protein K5787_19910 [Lentisphaeria bacterium]|nr:hypothetical protein [Lentisphaeria bacterium]